MTPIRRAGATAAIVLSMLGGASGPAYAEQKDHFELAWIIYAGWMPWGYMEEAGIIDKWADKYGISIDITQVNDYIEAINLYTAGRFDGATITNMDTLTIPAASGVDSTALVIGDYSNGNDALVLKGDDELADVAGKEVHLVQFSVSHYFLARALEHAGLSERDITTINTSDADIVAAFATPQVEAVAIWNPQLSAVLQDPNAHKVFDSSQIPGEILDMMVVNTETLRDNPELGKAVTGAWYETVALMNSGTPEGKKALQAMAEAAGTDLAGFKQQLEATYLFDSPEALLEFAQPEDLRRSMDFVRQFSWDHGLLGEGARSVDAVGIEFPDGSVLGDPDNVKMRFTTEFAQQAADGKL